MQAVILAGGLGSRLKPFTEIIPKPLLPVGEKAVLEIQIESLKKYGFNEIFIATNYKADYIESFLGRGERYGVNLYYSKEEKPLGTVGPLNLIKDKLKSPFLMMNGDILTLMNFKEFFDFAVSKGESLAVAIKKEIMPFEFGNIFFKGDYVTKIEEKPDLLLYILAGIYILTPEIFNYIPTNEYFGMDQLIKKLLSLDIKIPKYEIKEYWLDIGRAKDYEIAQSDVRFIKEW